MKKILFLTFLSSILLFSSCSKEQYVTATVDFYSYINNNVESFTMVGDDREKIPIIKMEVKGELMNFSAHFSYIASGKNNEEAYETALEQVKLIMDDEETRANDLVKYLNGRLKDEYDLSPLSKIKFSENELSMTVEKVVYSSGKVETGGFVRVVDIDDIVYP